MLTMSLHATERMHERWPGLDHDATIARVERVYEHVRATLPSAVIVTGNGVPFAIENGFVKTVLPKRTRARYSKQHIRKRAYRRQPLNETQPNV